MGIGNIMPAGYPSENRVYGTRRYPTGKKFGNQMEQVRGTQTSTGGLTLHYFDNEEGDKALGAMGAADGGSMTVYKPKDFDAANPVYKVRTWDAAGNMTEEMVDVSKVDPYNSSKTEMYAYSCYLTDSGQYSDAQDTFSRIAGYQREQDGVRLQKTDWMSILRDIMKMQYDAGNIQGYWNYKKFLDFVEK